MDTLLVLDHGTCLNRYLIREIYDLAQLDWLDPKVAKHVPDAHTDWIRSIAWAPNGSTFVTGSDDNSIAIWDSEGMLRKRVDHAHTDWIRSIAWAPNGSIFVTASADKSFKIWTGS